MTLEWSWLDLVKEGFFVWWHDSKIWGDRHSTVDVTGFASLLKGLFCGERNSNPHSNGAIVYGSTYLICTSWDPPCKSPRWRDWDVGSVCGFGKTISLYLKSHNVKHVTVHQLDTCHKQHLLRGLQGAVSQTLRFLYFSSAFQTELPHDMHQKHKQRSFTWQDHFLFCAHELGVRVGRHARGVFWGENSKRDACTDCHDVFCASQDTL